MVIMNDLEWPMLSYYVFYYETFRKVMQQTDKESLLKLPWRNTLYVIDLEIRCKTDIVNLLNFQLVCSLIMWL